MQDLFKTIGKILFYVFVVAVAGWTASLTLAEVKMILPNDPVTPYFALALFDGGALSWLMTFLGHGRGLVQRGLALLMLVLDLAGVVVLSAGRLLMGGQSLANIPTDMGATIVYALIAATLINLVAIYAFHIADPDTMEAIELQTLNDKLKSEAIDQARTNIEKEVQTLGAILAARATASLKYSLRLPMNVTEATLLQEDAKTAAADQPAALVIPGKFSKPSGLPAWMLKLRGKFKRPAPASAETPKPQSVNIPIPFPVGSDQSQLDPTDATVKGNNHSQQDPT
jgi:hypothetical protein